MSSASTQSQSCSVLPEGVVVYGILFLLTSFAFYIEGKRERGGVLIIRNIEIILMDDKCLGECRGEDALE